MSLASHKAGPAPRGRPSPGEAPSCSTVGGPAAGLGAPKGLPKTCGVLAVPCPAPASPRDGAPGGWCSGSQGACRPGQLPRGRAGLGGATWQAQAAARVSKPTERATLARGVDCGLRPTAVDSRWRVDCRARTTGSQDADGGTWGAEGPAGLLRFPLGFSAGLRLLLKNNPFLYLKKNTASCKAATYK